MSDDDKIEAFPTGKGTISFSELSDWSECSWRHRLKFVDSIEVPFEKNAYAVFGTAVHEACECYLKSGTMDPEIAVNRIEADWDEDVERFRFEQRGLERKSPLAPKEEWQQTARDILVEVPQFMDETFPGWRYVAAEQRLYEDIHRHDDLTFKGFIDAVISAPDSRGRDKIWIIDFKTAGWGWHRNKKSDFTVQLQLRLYKLFWAQKMGMDLNDVRCGFVLLKRTGSTGSRCELVPVSVGPKTRERSLKVMNNMISSVRNGIAVKDRSSCRFCDFFDTEHCPAPPDHGSRQGWR